jgi:membrane-associated HD superfamily phosphohydrolase
MSTNTANAGRRIDRSLVPRGDRNWWAWLRVILLGILLAAITAVVVILPRLPNSLLPTGRVAVEEGDVALNDIRAPRSVNYESAILREREQERAARQVQPVYTLPNPAIARQQLDRVRQVLDYLGSVRADTLASAAQKRGWILAVPELIDLSLDTLVGLLGLPDASWERSGT